MLKQMMLPIIKNRLKSFIVEQLPTTHVVISHPLMRTDSKDPAIKIGDIRSHLCKLQINTIENVNTNSNHLNSTEVHLNGKGVLQFAKNLIECIWKL